MTQSSLEIVIGENGEEGEHDEDARVLQRLGGDIAERGDGKDEMSNGQQRLEKQRGKV